MSSFARRWLATLAIIGAVELIATWLGPVASPYDRGVGFAPTSRVPTLDESLVHWQLERLRRTPAELVLLGDSSALMGLDPAVFERTTGLDTQSFATVSWLHTEGHADVLDLYLEHHGPPRAVVFQMGTLIHVYPQETLTKSGLLTSFRRWTGRDDPGEVPLPSRDLREIAREAIEGRVVPRQYRTARRGREPSDEAVRAWLEAHDGMYVDHSPRRSWAGLPPLKAVYRPHIETGLLRMIVRAETLGFDLFIAHNPVPDHFRAPARDAEYGAIEQRLVRATASFARVHVIGPFARYLPTRLFANFEHLRPAGARVNSRALADAVAEALGSPTAGSGEAGP